MRVLALVLLTVAVTVAQNSRFKRGNIGLGADHQTEQAIGADNHYHGSYSYAASGAAEESVGQSEAGALAVQETLEQHGGYDTLGYSSAADLHHHHHHHHQLEQHGHYGHHGHHEHLGHYEHHGHHAQITPIPAPQIVSKGETALTGVTIHKAVKVGVTQPVPIPIVKKVPYPLRVPYQVPVERPYPIHVPKYYPVQVERQVPYEVIREVPYPVKVIEKVPVEVPVYVPHYRPVPVPHFLHKPVPVPAPYPVTILVKEHIHKKGGWW